MKEYFCPNCCQNVVAIPSYSMVALILLLLCGIIPGLLYYLWKKDKRCPICHLDEDRLEPYRPPKHNDDNDFL